MSEPILTAQGLVDALGGVTKAAEAFGERYPSTVSNWLKKGRIPSSKFMAHKTRLDGLGVAAAPDIWFGRDAARVLQ